jgi:TonB-dependent receptor
MGIPLPKIVNVKKSLAALFACFFSIVLFAQNKSVKISGKVTDAATGAGLMGVSVTGEHIKGTRTDVEGNFFLILEEGKTYAIQFTSVGYQTKLLEGVQAGESNSSFINISLQKANVELTNVVIKTTARRETAAALYTTQKNSSAISDAISAEVIKKSPDRNTSEVLRRVSGTSIQDNKFVIIRGLNERYNSSLLNNSVLPSTEPDKKAFSFDIIPSSLIDNITIYKSPTPDLPGDFAGGAVKISTRDYPTKSLSELSVTGTYNSQTTFKNFYKGYPQGNLDWLGFFDNSRLIPGSYYANRGSAYSNLDNATKIAITKQFPNTYGSQPANQSQPAFSLSYVGGNTKLIKENKLGFIYALSYGNSRKVVERTRDEYESYNFHNYVYNTTSYDMKSTLSALLNVTYSYGKSKISLKNLFNNDFVNSLSIRNGTAGSGGVALNDPAVTPFHYKSQNTEASSNGIANSVLEGLHNLDKGWTIDWNASYGLTYRWQPDQRILTYRTADNNTDNYFIKLNNQNSPDPTQVGRVYSYLTENIYGGNVNFTKQFEWKGQAQKLKFGTQNYYRDRTVQVDALGLSTTSVSGIQIAETKSTTFNNLLNPSNIDQYGIMYANIPNNSTDYEGTGLLNSGYLMLDNRFSDKIKLTWGVRAERYLQELTAKGKNKLTLDNTDLLPSLLFTYAVNNKTNIRVAGSQTVNRPEFRELAVYRFYDYENAFIIQGNDKLVRAKNTNADLRYEWFPASGEIISASVFYKYFLHPIEQTNLNNDVLSFANADNASVYGVELEIRKRLNFFNNSFFDRLTFYANAAYMDGSVKFNGQTINSPLQGQSPYLLNGGLSYSADNDNFSMNILYNRIGQRLKFRAGTGAGRNIFEKPRDVIDFQLSKKFLGNRLEAKITVSDLLAQPFKWYYKYDADPSKTAYNASTDRILNSYKYGTNVSVGIRYSFAK